MTPPTTNSPSAKAPSSRWQATDGRGKSVHHLRTTCRACSQATLHRVLQLGNQPLANAFLRSPLDAQHETRFPLDLYFCTTCSLVQLADVIDPEVLFAEYIYVTGTSSTIAVHNQEYARTVRDRLTLGANDLVVEVASNDGSLLGCFKEFGGRILGVEPARNIAALAESRGIPTVNRFFDEAAGHELRSAHGAARAVIGNNVLAHVDDTQGFLRGAAALIADDGAVIVEVPYAREMLLNCEYDTIYHEHLCYFSVTSLAHLAQRVGLAVDDVQERQVHGGTIRVWMRKQSSHGARALEMMAAEEANGLSTLAAWEGFARRAAEHRRSLRLMLEELHGRGKVVAGYGAPAKGNTMLNYCGIDPTLVPYTVDRNPLKVGTFTPGMHIPVLDVKTLLERSPDFVLILAWNFAEEIMEQQQAYRDRGGRFIVPIPSPRIA